MVDIHKIADEAEVIIDGYAVSKCEAGCRVMNLNMPDKVTVFLLMGLPWRHHPAGTWDPDRSGDCKNSDVYKRKLRSNV